MANAKVHIGVKLAPFAASLLLYWALCAAPWSPVSGVRHCHVLFPVLYPFVKCAPILCLIIALVAERLCATRSRGLITDSPKRVHIPAAERKLLTGLAFSLFGDLLLALSSIFGGVCAFGVAQLAFNAAFGTQWTRSARAFVAFAAATVAFLVPLNAFGTFDALPMRLAVSAYYALVFATATSAANTSRCERRWAAGGAALFVLSDVLLGVEFFICPLPRLAFLIMPLYYAAQLAFVLAFLTKRPVLSLNSSSYD